jgi:hypothetical protein
MDIDHKQDNLKDSSPFIKPELLEKTSMGAFEFSGEMERLYAIKTDMRFDEATRKQAEKQLRMLEVMPNYFITEQQFANLIGRMRMYQVMPPGLRKDIPNLLISDTQINSVVKDYYFDKHFGRNIDGGVDIWSIYNLLTEANKSSYIDTFLDRSVNANQLCTHLMEALDHKAYSWYLN